MGAWSTNQLTHWLNLRLTYPRYLTPLIPLAGIDVYSAYRTYVTIVLNDVLLLIIKFTIMANATSAPQVVNVPVVETVETPVVNAVPAIDNSKRIPTTKADREFGFPEVANPARIVAVAVGLISAMRLIVQPTVNEDNEVVRQGLMLVTITRGTTILTATIGTAYLGAIEGLTGKDGLGKSVRFSYEICKEGLTTYEDNGELHYHGVNGNRIIELNPMDSSSYLEYLMAEERTANINMIMDGAKQGVDMSALVAYLKG